VPGDDPVDDGEDVGDAEVVAAPVDPETDAGVELTGVIVPATDIDETGSCEVANGVGVGVLSVDEPSAVEVGTVGDEFAVVPCAMAAGWPAAPDGAVAFDPAVVEPDAVVGVVPDDDPAVADPPLDDVSPLLDVEGVVVAAVEVEVDDGVVVVGTFTM
jgi:hypothetical protein